MLQLILVTYVTFQSIITSIEDMETYKEKYELTTQTLRIKVKNKNKKIK